VKEIIPWFNSRYVLRLDNETELEVSKVYSKILRNTLKI
jgi:two-component system response regulator LytT